MKERLKYSEAVTRYAGRMRAQQKSDDTIRVTLPCLNRLGVWLKDHGHGDPWVGRIEPHILDDYFFGEDGVRAPKANGKAISNVTFNNYRAYTRGLFQWLKDARFIDNTPMDLIQAAPKVDVTARLILTPTELIEFVDRAPNPRDRALFATAMQTGLRAHDLRMLTVGDVSLGGNLITTQIRKVRKHDAKPITLDLHHELDRWFAEYARMTGVRSAAELPNSWTLFPRLYRSRAGKLYVRPGGTMAAISKIANDHLSNLGYPTDHEGFHTLRRSAARALFEALQGDEMGRDRALLIVRDFLNHSNTAITELYLGLSHERVARDTILRGKPFLTALAARESAAADTSVVPNPFNNPFNNPIAISNVREMTG